MQTKPKLGPIEVEKRPYLWKDLFRFKLVEAFAGETGDKELLATPEGKAKLDAAKTATTTALGYSLEDATKQDAEEDAARELRYARKHLKSPEDELCDCSPQVL